MGGGNLPYARRLAYLEVNDGSQYLDTKIIPDENTDFDIDYQCLSNGDGGAVGIFFVIDFFGFYCHSVFSRYCYGNNTWLYFINTKSNERAIFSFVSTKKEIRINGDVVGNLTSLTGSTTQSIKTIGWGRTAYGRYYGWKIYHNRNLIQSAIPVMSYEGRAEMYDEVSGAFIERHGDFIYGELT